MHTVINGEVIELSEEESEITETEWATNKNLVDINVNNMEIMKQLDEIDRKSIRAIRSGETARMMELEAQAIILRSKLL